MRWAENGLRAVELAAELKPDVIVTDIQMPEMNGLEATRVIKRDHPEIQIIGISLWQAEYYAKPPALKAGASAFVCKPDIVRELVPAILAAVNRGQASS